MNFIDPEQFITGLEKSRYRYNESNDCVVKAFAILFGIPYDEAHGFTRAFFDRRERNGTQNFPSCMLKMVGSKNFSFNGTIRRVKLIGNYTINKIQSNYTKGIYLVGTNNHVSVLFDGNWIDYPNNVKPKQLVFELYEFKNFEHYEVMRNHISKPEESGFDKIYIVFVFIIIGIIYNFDKIINDLSKLKYWIEQTMF